jgi:hypothetical protein
VDSNDWTLLSINAKAKKSVTESEGEMQHSPQPSERRFVTIMYLLYLFVYPTEAA